MGEQQLMTLMQLATLLEYTARHPPTEGKDSGNEAGTMQRTEPVAGSSEDRCIGLEIDCCDDCHDMTAQDVPKMLVIEEIDPREYCCDNAGQNHKQTKVIAVVQSNWNQQ